MTANLGPIDRVLRAVVGIVLLALPFVSALPVFASGIATYVSVGIGAVLIVTAAVRFCPLYRILGIRTCTL